MYVNNISERSSSRVLQRPGGAQSINIFGGADEPTEQPQQQRTGGRRRQQEITPSIGSHTTPVDQPKPTFTPHTSSIAGVFNDGPQQPAAGQAGAGAAVQVSAPFAQGEAPAAGAAPAAGGSSPRVNNIWGSDEPAQRSSTRVLRGPGGGSSGVAGALSGGPQQEVEVKRTGAGYRSNQTSVNSPFSSEPEPQRSSTRVHQAPGGGSSGNILSWGH